MPWPSSGKPRLYAHRIKALRYKDNEIDQICISTSLRHKSVLKNCGIF